MSEVKGLPYIEDLKAQYDLGTFVETGCWKGDGIQAALDMGFSTVYSCDCNEDWVNHCHVRFSGDNRVVVELVKSVDFLKKLFQDELRGVDALFWLDAHFPNYCSGGNKFDDEGDLRFPLVEELRLIKSNTSKSVIYCDDMRVLADSGRQHEHAALPVIVTGKP